MMPQMQKTPPQQQQQAQTKTPQTPASPRRRHSQPAQRHAATSAAGAATGRLSQQPILYSEQWGMRLHSPVILILQQACTAAHFRLLDPLEIQLPAFPCCRRPWGLLSPLPSLPPRGPPKPPALSMRREVPLWAGALEGALSSLKAQLPAGYLRGRHETLLAAALPPIAASLANIML